MLGYLEGDTQGKGAQSNEGSVRGRYKKYQRPRTASPANIGNWLVYNRLFARRVGHQPAYLETLLRNQTLLVDADPGQDHDHEQQ